MLTSEDGETFPSLSLVGWYTFGSSPTPWHARIQLQLRQQFECDSPIFLLYHWDQLNSNNVGGKLPFTVYESFAPHESSAMDVDYADESQTIRFRPISYSLETADDEAIALADIVHGATAASAVQQTSNQTQSEKDKRDIDNEKTKSNSEDELELADYLSAEDEDSKWRQVGQLPI
jgi:hypothetical protein